MTNIERERSRGFSRGKSARGSAAAILHEHGPAVDDREWLSQVFHPRAQRSSWTQVEDDHMILGNDHLFEREV